MHAIYIKLNIINPEHLPYVDFYYRYLNIVSSNIGFETWREGASLIKLLAIGWLEEGWLEEGWLEEGWSQEGWSEEDGWKEED